MDNIFWKEGYDAYYASQSVNPYQQGDQNKLWQEGYLFAENESNEYQKSITITPEEK